MPLCHDPQLFLSPALLLWTPIIPWHHVFPRLFLLLSLSLFFFHVAQPWFRAAPYGRKDAEAELKDAATGAFVVRPSSDVGKYAVSVKRKSGDVDHMLIIPSWVSPKTKKKGEE